MAMEADESYLHPHVPPQPDNYHYPSGPPKAIPDGSYYPSGPHKVISGDPYYPSGPPKVNPEYPSGPREGYEECVRGMVKEEIVDYSMYGHVETEAEAAKRRKQFEFYKEFVPLKEMKVVLHKYVVRPAPIPAAPKYVQTTSGVNHALNQQVWMHVFQYLSPKQLCACMCVCRTWNRWSIDRRLWASINLSRCRIKKDHLVGVVRRQPMRLDLSFTNISRKQLTWLVARLPQLKYLSLAGNSWSAACTLCSSVCPLLLSLDLKWVADIRDNAIKDLVSPPTDHRPGVDDSVSRLRRLQTLLLAGSDIGDGALEIIVTHMPHLSCLDLSYCTNVTDAGVGVLASDQSSTRHTLRDIDLTGCHRLTRTTLDHMRQLTKLTRLFVQSCPNIVLEDCRWFIRNCPHRRYIMREHGMIEYAGAV